MHLPAENLAELASKTTWILDGDGVLYPNDSVFAEELWDRIASNFNHMTAHDAELASEFLSQLTLKEKNQIADPLNITDKDLGLAYVPIIQTLIERDKENLPLGVSLDQLYGHGHEEGIEPDPKLVEAFKLARAKGIKIFFNTNSPSGNARGQDLHIQHTMRALGFDEETIDYMRCRTFDIVDAVNLGYQKENPIHYNAGFFNRFGGLELAHPHEALMMDDKVKNISAANAVRISPIWAHTSDAEPKQQDVDLAEHIGAPRIRKVGETLLEIAEAHTPTNT